MQVLCSRMQKHRRAGKPVMCRVARTVCRYEDTQLCCMSMSSARRSVAAGNPAVQVRVRVQQIRRMSPVSNAGSVVASGSLMDTCALQELGKLLHAVLLQ